MILKELSVAKNCLRPEIAPLRSVIGFHFLQHIMIGSWSLEEEKIIKDIRDLFRLKEELNYTPIKDIRNLFRQEKETKTVKDRRVSSQVISSQQKLVSFGVTIILNIFWSNNYIEYKNNGNWNKTLSVEEYLNKIRPYLYENLVYQKISKNLGPEKFN